LRTPTRVAVLASGGGSNLQALIDRFHGDDASPARVVLVVGSRAGIGALDRAERAGIDGAVLDPRELGAEAFAAALLTELERFGVELVVLAGWLQLLPSEVVARFPGPMLNVHPALLPAFGGHGMYGMRVHRAVVEAGVRVSGATVHLVDERYDSGAVVAQWPVPVLPGDTAETLAARVLKVEHRLLPAAVEALAAGLPSNAAAEDPLCFALAADPVPPDEHLQATLRLPAGGTGPGGG
jgi:formyltetrahydrofolate-dependent phosphoribosylglycinamide formyltransferase